MKLSILPVVAIAVAAGCAPRSQPADPAPAPEPMKVVDQSTLNPAAQARADGGKPPYVKADVDFMQGMIHHHSQAILIGKWAPTHNAGDAVQRLAARIVVAQRDEIALMRTWLADRNEQVPSPDTIGMKPDAHASHNMPGHTMPGMVMMPGMLSQQQLAQLDSARGREFDRLFLQYMIQHHLGAITMVEQLLGTYGAAQDGIVYRFATDVEADQSAEIERMSIMLAAIGGGSSTHSPKRENR